MIEIKSFSIQKSVAMTPDEQQFLEWNRQGLIPGPEETESQFVERAKHCLNLKHELKLDPDFVVKHTDEIIQPSLNETQKYYDMAPDWIPIVFGNKQLAPWHGGCAWIFQLTDPGPLGAFIQLRTAFLSSGKYLGLYSREELISHELCHAGRMAFNEPKYEEMLAYKCSKRWLPRILGPLVESSLESMIFLLTLFTVVFVEAYSLYYGEGLNGETLLGLLALPVAMVFYAVIRLFVKFWHFHKCYSVLNQTLKNPQKANGVAYRLTDKEFKLFSAMQPSAIALYSKEQKAQSLRWKIIDLVYFSTS